MTLAGMILLDLLGKAEARVYYRVDVMKNGGQMLLNIDIKDLRARDYGSTLQT